MNVLLSVMGDTLETFFAVSSNHRVREEGNNVIGEAELF